ncbi:P-loop containing nucleoside triphosphate hydrolase protein [Clavulina sp. PMI_390]|nr:P-loop containing nucleoside triphosphate hydrolase protein [Clavulina sp. PMI_390]
MEGSEAAGDKPSAVKIDIPPKAEEKLPNVSFLQLFRFATPLEAGLNIVGIIAALLAGAAQPMLSLFFGRLTNSFVNFEITSQIIRNGNYTAEQLDEFHVAQAQFKHAAAQDAGYQALIGLATFALTCTYMLIWTYTGERNTRRIREHYLKAVLRQEVAYFDQLGAGEVTTRIQTDTHLIQQGISEKIPILASFMGAFFSGYILAYIKSWRLALAMSSILPLLMVTGVSMGVAMSGYTKTSLKHVAEGGNIAEEAISNIRTAKAFGIQARLARLFNNHATKAYQAELKSAVVLGVSMGFFFLWIYGSYALGFGFGTTLALQGHGDIGNILNVIMAILEGSFSFGLLASELQAITTAIAAASKIFSTIDRVPVIDSAAETGLRPSSTKGALELDNVFFTYPSRRDVPVLKGVSLNFAPGTTSALVGASGCGKSTIVALIERFYDPILYPSSTSTSSSSARPESPKKASTSKDSSTADGTSVGAGTVKLDGVDIRNLNIRWLRSQLGFVQQEPVLFATTVFHNVAYGLIGSKSEDVDDAEKRKLVEQACKTANAHDFVMKLPKGYNTRVGERGFLLSGGQKQRIAIARAIVGDPAILLLDEATSALDTESEGIVQDALNRAAEGRTTITVAHRLSTIKNADRIYVIGDGLVVESGTHNELLQTADGPYSRLVSAQALREQQNREGLPQQGEPDRATSIEGTELEVASELVANDDLSAKDAIPLTRIATKASTKSGIQAALEDELPKYPFGYLIKRMVAINKISLWDYLLGTIGSIIGGAVYPVFGIVYSKAINGFTTTDPHQIRHNGSSISGNMSALYMMIIAIASGLALSLQYSMFHRGAARMAWRLRNIIFTSILRQDVRWFDDDRHSTGALVSNVAGNPQKIMALAGVTLGSIVQSLATLLIGLCLGFAYGWKLAFVALTTVPFLLSAGFIRLLVVMHKDEHNRRAHEESAQVACEGVGAIRTVASLKREKTMHQEYSDTLDAPMRRAVRAGLWGSALYGFTQCIEFFSISLVFYYGSLLVAKLSYTSEQFYICLMSITFGAFIAGNSMVFVPDISSARISAAWTTFVMDSRPEIDAESEDGHAVETPSGHLELRNVRFSYPTRVDTPVLRGINITIKPGSYVAIVGASGCGKSTLIQLIERFYDPYSGQILLDGQNIASLNVAEYRNNISLVSQEPTLYSGTLRFNITLGSGGGPEEISQAALEEACREANILEFIQGLPDGFDTDVGGKGSQLSGGQKQRVAIARALIRNPKILLLDEATSALDSTSEKIVQEALDNASRGRTTIAIAHRLSTIQNADQIYFLRDGLIAECGTHDELLALRGGYYELVQLQAQQKHITPTFLY